MDLVHWIKIQWPRSTAGDKAGLTGMSRFDQRRGAIGTAGCTSDGHGPAQAGGTAAAAHCGERAGAKAIRRCGAPKAAGTAPQRPGARGEPHGGHPKRLQRGAAVTRRATAAAELRRTRAGDAEHGRPNQQHRWAPYLTAVPLGSSKATERRRDGGERAEPERRR
jgi:hypothetical protein